MKGATANKTDARRQVSTPAIEAALQENPGKQICMLAKLVEQFCFRISTSAFANQSPGDRLTISANRLWSRTTKQQADPSPNVIDNQQHPCAIIVKIVFCASFLRGDEVIFVNSIFISPEIFSNLVHPILRPSFGKSGRSVAQKAATGERFDTVLSVMMMCNECFDERSPPQVRKEY